MPRPGPTLLHGSRMLLTLQMVLMLSWPPPGGALALAEKSLPGSPGPSDLHPDASTSQELRKGFEDLLTRLRMNHSREDLNADPVPSVRILTPELWMGSEGHLRLRISRAALIEMLPVPSLLHRALFRLSPKAPRSWDVTGPLHRQLSLSGPQAPALHLRLSPPLSPSEVSLAASRSARPQLELHLRSHATRARRKVRARTGDNCPLGPGRCCQLHTVRASLNDLGWSSWVHAPRELQVTMCVGACPSQFRVANMHSQIKASLHRLKPDLVPAPCCVPSSYSPMVIMQKTDTGGVLLQTYDDLLAKDCHCV
ncbi:growth/differentiation factor 15 [Nycticebus coucang]|uniref:growth/differentiation factor 15 n=1 Tax=Nycticebus coucang TaxID=9470 RepID=UPI00234C5B80|nr:growth/differentiation factor 15 [Nycticebus coucang]